MYKNSTKSSRKTYTFTWEYQAGTGTNLNHQLLIVSVIQLFCSSDAQYWPALIGWLAAICNVIGWGLVGPGGRDQPRMEPCTSGHRDTNKVARIRDIFDSQYWLCYDSSLSDNICTSVWPFKFVEWLWLVLITQKAVHQNWFILMTICKKWFSSLKLFSHHKWCMRVLKMIILGP